MKYPIWIPAVALMLTGCATDSVGTSQGPNWGGIAREVLEGYGQTTPGAAALSEAQIVAGLKEALTVGAGTVVAQLGQVDGFRLDPKIHIPLPTQLQKVDAALRMVGMNSLTQDLEARLNRAAELVTPRAKPLFIGSIRQMTLTDAREILFGGKKDAATQFFRRTMGAQLVTEIEPIIESTLAESGAIKAFDQATGRYNQLPLVGQVTEDAKADLNTYVANRAVDGIFYYIAQEEAAIRENPVKRTTEILKVVFGAID